LGQSDVPRLKDLCLACSAFYELIEGQPANEATAAELLGSRAVGKTILPAVAAAALAARAEEDARWRALSLSTDHDGFGDVRTGGATVGGK
jgi:hypothetical protein